MVKKLEDYIYENEDGSKSLFLKFSSLNAIDNMIINGEYWFRPYGHFWYSDIVQSNHLTGDKEEGKVKEHVRLNDTNIFKNIRMNIYKDFKETEADRIICLYEIKLEEFNCNPIDSEMDDFGEYVSLVDYKALINSLEKACPFKFYQQNPIYDSAGSFIIDDNHFYKAAIFKYQHEKRICLKTNIFIKDERVDKLNNKIEKLRCVQNNLHSNVEKINIEHTLELLNREILSYYEKEEYTFKTKLYSNMISNPVLAKNIYGINNVSQLKKIFDL